MAYAHTQLDKANLHWFETDNTRGTLVSIQLFLGEMRGLTPFKLEMEYPITAIAGANGAGKTTLLALAACAFHNRSRDVPNAPGATQPYYRFSDFLIQAEGEATPDGLYIYYRIRSDRWQPAGLGTQIRKKRVGGKWNDYATRIPRNVVYLGVQRVVPHAEKSVSRSYRRRFKLAKEEGWETDVRESVGRVLGRTYEKFHFWEAGSHRLPVVSRNGATYSGFNMGAGENTLFEIFAYIYSRPKGLLLVVDELELGLHEEAQRRLIDELKEVCSARRIQVICTTHSRTILERLPPEARFYIGRVDNKTSLIAAVTPDHAATLLSGIAHPELWICVEDRLAQTILELALPRNIRQRIRILDVGSAANVMRHMAIRLKDEPNVKALAVLDADQQPRLENNCAEFLRIREKATTKSSDNDWIRGRISYLPGPGTPEDWIFGQGTDLFAAIATEAGVTQPEFVEQWNVSRSAGFHKELKSLADWLGWDIERLRGRLAACIASHPDLIPLRQRIELLLQE